MNGRIDPTIDFNDEDSNRSDNPTFENVLRARLDRRRMLGGIATLFMGGVALAACSDDAGKGSTPATPDAGSPSPDAATPLADAGAPVTTDAGPTAPPEKLLGFRAVPKSLEDRVLVPAGYTAAILYALGDPLRASTADFKNDGTDDDFENRAGDHHDGMEWFGLATDGSASATATTRGLLAVNHEATTDELRASFFLHATGGTRTLPRPAAEIDKEVAVHGISVVEVAKAAAKWSYVKDSPFNFRLTPLSEVDIAGPARGNALLVTKYSADGTKTRGTLNNCGTGKTPWGTFLTGEENWFGYFARSASDDAARGNDKSVTSLKRYGRSQGSTSRHGWESGGSEDRFARWDISKTGASTTGADDYRNEMNGQGYIVEIDPYTKSSRAKKRTGLGRFAHESAAFGTPKAGKRLAVYMGDDARNEYIYKWVSDVAWDAADANPSNRLAAGDKYLDRGKLYVAKFGTDGKGTWIELSLDNPLVANSATYRFADAGDVCINARLAADAVGATKMDRPEWCSVNPKNGEIYFALTNNSNRRVEPASGGSQLAPDSANPRVYTDVKGASTTSVGNPNGHILRMREDGDESTATTFGWDVYLFAAEASASSSAVNLSNLTGDQDLSSPDGIVFSPSTGICWIQTDDGAFTDVTNCMMLAAIPGTTGDGGKRTLTYSRADSSSLTVDTYVGKAPTEETLKRFLVGPKDCEITGLCETPDGKTLFINVQHPGEGTAQANVADPTKYTSQWPSNAGYGAGKRPRSATIVITKDDGGRIGT
jgi:uncharacterized protein